jgi:imidazolonepropionase-like amidohydrolase
MLNVQALDSYSTLAPLAAGYIREDSVTANDNFKIPETELDENVQRSLAMAMDETRYIIAGHCIDGTGAGSRKNVFLAMNRGLITAIGPAADLPCHDQTAVTDLSHCTLVPALVDCSVSLSRSPSVDTRMQANAEAAGSGQRATLIDRHISYCHGHGVLGLADCDDSHNQVQQRKTMVAQEYGMVIRTSGSLRLNRDDHTRSDHPDFIKIVSASDMGTDARPEPRLSDEDLCQILGQRGNAKKVVVANGSQAVAQALAAGCDAIEQGYLMGEENLRIMAAKNVLWIPSVILAKNGVAGSGSDGGVFCRFSLGYAATGKPDPAAKAFWQKMLVDQLTQLEQARAMGVTTAIGTGAGSTGILHGESVVEEMKLFIKAGYSLGETIRCASVNGAHFFGMKEFGPLTVGQPATFLVTRGTPNQLPRKLLYLEGITINGAPSPAYRKNPVKVVWKK